VNNELGIDHLDIVRIFSPLYLSKSYYYNYEWHRFINDIDIGIAVTMLPNKIHRYTISDHKKWLLTRLKYGI
jgi:hypothetical protein